MECSTLYFLRRIEVVGPRCLLMEVAGQAEDNGSDDPRVDMSGEWMCYQ